MKYSPLYKQRSMSLSVTPPDIVRKIASDRSLSLSDILNLCHTSQWFNTTICENNNFWFEIARERITEHAEGMEPEVIQDVLRDIEVHTNDDDDDNIRRDFAIKMLQASYERVFLNFPEDSPMREEIVNESTLYRQTALRMLPLMTPTDQYGFI